MNAAKHKDQLNEQQQELQSNRIKDKGRKGMNEENYIETDKWRYVKEMNVDNYTFSYIIKKL